MTQHRDLFAALAAPFDPEEVKTRSQAGRQLSYITARTAMNRLDDVLGPENWWDEYTQSQDGALCRLTIRLPDGQVITKCDAGGCAGMADPGDDDKSGISDAFKRAAVKFGVGRYLYRDGIPRFAREALKGQPEATAPRAEPRAEPVRNGNGKANGKDLGIPTTGAALFAWTKKQEEEHGVSLVKPMNAWAKHHGLPWKMAEWPSDAISDGHREACRIIAAALATRQTIPPRRADPVTQDEADMSDQEWEDGRE